MWNDKFDGYPPETQQVYVRISTRRYRYKYEFLPTTSLLLDE
jgi:hypothetical protein